MLGPLQRWTAVVAAVVTGLSLAGISQPAAATPASPPAQPGVADAVEHVPGRIIVRFEADADRRAIAAGVHARARHDVGLANTQVLQVPAGTERRAVERLQARPDVVYAERDVEVRAVSEPNDPLWTSQWGAEMVRAPEAWNTTTGDSDVVIAVLDTGVAAGHEDVGTLVAGRNTVDDNADTDDGHGHGTSAASVATAPQNDRGLAGLCARCSLMPVKVLSDDGTGGTSDLAAGITWAADHGADVITMSLGATESTHTLDQAVSDARSQGVLLVAAAGNGDTTAPFYPAANERVVGVAASDYQDQRYGWSNYGHWVDVAAPGCNPAAKLDNSYTTSFCGTSSAAPVVAGIAGLGLAADPGATADELQTAVTTTAVDVGDWVAHGRVDAAGVVTALQASPGSTDSGSTSDSDDSTSDGSTSDGDTSEDSSGDPSSDGGTDGGTGDDDSADGDASGGDTTGDDSGNDGSTDGEPDATQEPVCAESRVGDTAGFADILGNPHADNIACVAWYGIAQGTGADTYAPAAPVRRDQMATFLVRFLETAGAPLPTPQPQGFTDLAGNPHADRVRQLAALGIARGTTADTYAPAAPVRRDQMATFLVRAYEYLDGDPLPRAASPFTDTPGNPHAPNIAKAAAAGIAQGTTADTYAPAAPVRRDQLATFLARTLEHATDGGLLSLPLL